MSGSYFNPNNFTNPNQSFFYINSQDNTTGSNNNNSFYSRQITNNTFTNNTENLQNLITRSVITPTENNLINRETPLFFLNNNNPLSGKLNITDLTDISNSDNHDDKSIQKSEYKNLKKNKPNKNFAVYKFSAYKSKKTKQKSTQVTDAYGNHIKNTLKIRNFNTEYNKNNLDQIRFKPSKEKPLPHNNQPRTYSFINNNNSSIPDFQDNKNQINNECSNHDSITTNKLEYNPKPILKIVIENPLPEKKPNKIVLSSNQLVNTDAIVPQQITEENSKMKLSFILN